MDAVSTHERLFPCNSASLLYEQSASICQPKHDAQTTTNRAFPHLKFMKAVTVFRFRPQVDWDSFPAWWQASLEMCFDSCATDYASWRKLLLPQSYNQRRDVALSPLLKLLVTLQCWTLRPWLEKCSANVLERNPCFLRAAGIVRPVSSTEPRNYYH